MAQNFQRPSIQANVRQPLLYDDHGISKDRQKFLIICVFDFAFATLLWLLSTVTKGDDWASIFFQEINIFEPHFLSRSLFDIVIVCFMRMMVLLISFAWLRMKHWLPVAITTTITTFYVIIKILFFFKKDHGSLPQYLTILTAFILGWVELWLLPFRVLAHERRHDDISIETPTTETSVVRNINNTTEDEFRSALEFSSDEDESQYTREQSIHPLYLKLNLEMKNECLKQASLTVNKAGEIINDAKNWKRINSNPLITYNDKLNSYYLKKEFNCSVKGLFEASWKDNALWNNQVKSANVLNTIDNNTELVRIVSQPAMNGYIASREFIDVRRVTYDKETNTYFCTYASISSVISQKIPIVDGLVRGINGINVVKITPSESMAISVFEFIMNTDIKGRVPKMAIRSTTKSFLINYMESLKKYIDQNAEKYL